MQLGKSANYLRQKMQQLDRSFCQPNHPINNFQQSRSDRQEIKTKKCHKTVKTKKKQKKTNHYEIKRKMTL